MCSGDYSSLIRKKRENKPPVENVYKDDFLNQLEEFIPHLTETKFYGGEPFIIEIYYQIWNKIIDINPSTRISVQTNATVLNNKVKKLLEKGKFHLNISLDSLKKETYEGIRINANFEKVMENIAYFHSYCKENNTFFGISSCPMRQNWKELPELVKFCNNLDTPVYFHMVWFPQTASLWNLDSKALKEIKDYLSSFDLPENTNIEKKNKSHYHDFISQVNSWYNKALEREAEFEKERKIIIEENKISGQLRSELVEKIRQNIFSDNTLENDTKKIKFKICVTKIENVFNRFPENYPLTRALKKLLNDFPVDLLVSELQTETEDGLYEKLKDVMFERT